MLSHNLRNTQFVRNTAGQKAGSGNQFKLKCTVKGRHIMLLAFIKSDCKCGNLGSQYLKLNPHILYGLQKTFLNHHGN